MINSAEQADTAGCTAKGWPENGTEAITLRARPRGPGRCLAAVFPLFGDQPAPIPRKALVSGQ